MPSPDEGVAPVSTNFGIDSLLFAAVTTAYILVAIQFEERDLAKMLGQAYVEYLGRVPALIPFTKGRSSG